MPHQLSSYSGKFFVGDPSQEGMLRTIGTTRVFFLFVLFLLRLSCDLLNFWTTGPNRQDQRLGLGMKRKGAALHTGTFLNFTYLC